MRVIKVDPLEISIKNGANYTFNGFSFNSRYSYFELIGCPKYLKNILDKHPKIGTYTSDYEWNSFYIICIPGFLTEEDALAELVVLTL